MNKNAIFRKTKQKTYKALIIKINRKRGKMYRLKKIKILSFANTLTIIYFIIGILYTILLTFIKMLNIKDDILGNIEPNIVEISYRELFTIFPIGFALGGFIMGLLIGMLYNLSSRITKGIVVELSNDNNPIKKRKK